MVLLTILRNRFFVLMGTLNSLVLLLLILKFLVLCCPFFQISRFRVLEFILYIATNNLVVHGSSASIHSVAVLASILSLSLFQDAPLPD